MAEASSPSNTMLIKFVALLTDCSSCRTTDLEEPVYVKICHDVGPVTL